MCQKFGQVNFVHDLIYGFRLQAILIPTTGASQMNNLL